MPNPYPILETYLSQGYSVEFSMGDDRWFYIVASHPAKGRIEAGGKTISDSVIMLDSRLKDRAAVEHSVQSDGQYLCERCGHPESDHPVRGCAAFARRAGNANRWAALCSTK